MPAQWWHITLAHNGILIKCLWRDKWKSSFGKHNLNSENINKFVEKLLAQGNKQKDVHRLFLEKQNTVEASASRRMDTWCILIEQNLTHGHQSRWTSDTFNMDQPQKYNFEEEKWSQTRVTRNYSIPQRLKICQTYKIYALGDKHMQKYEQMLNYSKQESQGNVFLLLMGVSK